jgi:hypothetical protein
LIGVVAIAISLWLPVHAVAQTPEGLAAADRLIVVQNLEAVMKDMATSMMTNVTGATETQKQALIAEMTAPAFLDRYKAQMRVAFAKHMTVDELNALSEFYSRPIAAAAMKKLGATTADVMPFLQAEMPAMVERVLKIP